MIFYALTLFNVGGSGDLTGSEQTVVVGGLQILSCFLATCLIDVLGRRVLLTVSSVLMGLFLILLGKRLPVANPVSAMSTKADNTHAITRCPTTLELWCTDIYILRDIQMNILHEHACRRAVFARNIAYLENLANITYILSILYKKTSFLFANFFIIFIGYSLNIWKCSLKNSF